MATPHTDLETQLASLDPALVRRLAAAGFDRARFLELAATLTEGDAALRRRLRNTVKGEVMAPRPGEIAELPRAGTPEHERLRAIGAAALARGELAFCTMAGGMATRMGGIVKALAEVEAGRTFLDLRLGENRSASARAGRPIPLWLMTSEATPDALTKALEGAGAPAHVACFMQDLSLRLTPDGALFLDERGAPSVHATGHGDLVDALRRAGLLDAFVAGGGKYVWITNVDNLGASIDEAVLGHFIEATARGIDVQCEVCPKAGDKGGIPVLAEGKLQVLEEFRLPPGFDPRTVDVFNTNTFLVARADREGAARLDLLRGREDRGRAAGHPVRAPRPGDHRAPADDVPPRPARGRRVALLARQGPRGARAAKGGHRRGRARARDDLTTSQEGATPVRRSGKLAALSQGRGPPVHFEIVHEFDIPLDALELAVISPTLCQRLAHRLANIESVQQKEHVLKDDRLERVWGYRANVRIPAFARAYVTPEMMAWEERSTYDIPKHASEWTITPRVKPEWRKYFASTGTYLLTSLDSGRTKRTVTGTVELRVPVLRQVAEKLIVAEVRKVFDAEAETLRDLATLV